MSTSMTTEAPETATTASIIDGHRVYFDTEDSANNGLYLCVPNSVDTPNIDPLLAQMRAAQLWVSEEPAVIPDKHKEAYKKELQLEESITVSRGLLLCACDHPKYPLDRERWAAWKAFFIVD